MGRLRSKVLGVAGAVLLAVTMGVAPVLAASNSTRTPNLPGGDYIRTNIWLGNMYWDTFNAQSSTIVYGNYPYYPYITDDDLTVNVNGWDITISVPPSGHVVNYSSATFNCEEVYTGYCGNAVYNISMSGFWWNNTGNDQSRTILYPNTQPFYNNAGVTNWCC